MKLRLSEAIRLGSMLKPQAMRYMFRDGKTCALGAVLDAVGNIAALEREEVEPIMEMWPWSRSMPGCPLCDGRSLYTVTGIIAHLNDHHGWTRERIADWVASVEPQEEAVEVVEVEVAGLGGSHDCLCKL